MANRQRRWLALLAGMTCLVSLVWQMTVAAQTDASARLYPLQIAKFPLLSAFLDVHDSQGNFVHGLTPANVTMIEASLRVPALELVEQGTEVNLVLAISPGPSFEIRDSQGVSRYEHLTRKLGSWQWDAQKTAADRLSMLAPGSVEPIEFNSPADVISTLQTTSFAQSPAIPGLEILSRAIEAAAAAPRPESERAVLFITAPPTSDITASVENISARASQQGVKIYIWLLAAADYFTLPGAVQLRALAESSGGQFFTFSGSEEVPNPEGYLEQLRFIYFLTYQSKVTTSGSHQVVAEIISEGLQISSTHQTLNLQLLPPEPSFLGLPTIITRTLSAQGQIGAETVTWTPVTQTLSLQITFPDGYERSLVRSSLFVDGMQVVEKTTIPFDVFTWDLSQYSVNTSHRLQVEVVDAYGLSSRSPELAVQIAVPPASEEMLTAFAQNWQLIIGVTILLLIAFLVLGLIISGRIRPHVYGRGDQRTRPFRHRPAKPQPLETSLPADVLPSEKTTSPDSQSQPIKRRLGGLLQRGSHPQTLSVSQAMASLIPYTESESGHLPAPLFLEADEILLGSDSTQATMSVDDPSVDSLHSRLTREGSTYRLFDLGTVAGTWVNYELVPPSGVLLAHRDIIHLGRISFRYQMQIPGPVRKPVVHIEAQ